MNNDSINRRAAIEEMTKISFTMGHPVLGGNWKVVNAEKAIDKLAELPPVKTEPEWIPTFKELPKDNGFVLVQSVFGDYLIAQYENDEKEWYTKEEYTPWTPEAIVAWRPLPDPYDGPKNDRDFSGSKMPYNDIANYIVEHINGYIDDYVVKLSLDGKTYTELLTYTGEYFEWLNDWYEGEEHIELLDFFPLEDAVRKGAKDV